MSAEKDNQLIKLLQKNGRASYADLAAELGLTSSTVAKRTKHLINSGTLSVRAMLNPYKLGLKAGAVVLMNIEQSKKEEVYNNLNKNILVTTIFITLGKHDVVCVVREQTWERLNGFISNYLAKMDGVVDYDCLFIKDTVKRSHNLFGDGKPFQKEVQLKRVDKEIVELLCLDGRQSNSDLAVKLGLHVSTISRRVSYLTSQEFIKVMPQPNPVSFNFASSAIIVANIEAKTREDICEDIMKLEEVFLLLQTINRPQIVVGIHSKTNETIGDLINEKLLSYRDVTKSEIYLRSKVIKSSYDWSLDKVT